MTNTIRVVHLSDLHVCENLETLANLFWDFVKLSAPPLVIRALLKRLLADEARRAAAFRLLTRGEGDAVSSLKVAGLAVLGLPLMIYLAKQFLNFKRVFYISSDLPQAREVLAAHVREENADAVVVTGDLANSAHVREFAAARQFLDALGDPGSVCVIPGNHDVNMHDTYLRGVDTVQRKLGNFLEAVGDYVPQVFPSELGLTQARPFPFVRLVGDDLALIGLDSTTYHPVLNIRGRIDGEQLNSLQQLLSTGALRRRFIIVMLHHHLTPTAFTDDRQHWLVKLYSQLERSVMDELDNAEQVATVLAAGGVNLVIHGHHHYTYRTVIKGIPVHCSGSSIYPGRHGELRPYYHLYTIRNGELSVSAKVWNGDQFALASPL